MRGFIEVIFVVARRRYPTLSLLESVQQFLAYCRSAIEEDRQRTASASSLAASTTSTSTPSGFNLHHRLPHIGSSRVDAARDRSAAGGVPSTDRTPRLSPISGSMANAAGTWSLPSVCVTSSPATDPVRRSAADDGAPLQTADPRRTSPAGSPTSLALVSAARRAVGCGGAGKGAVSSPKLDYRKVPQQSNGIATAGRRSVTETAARAKRQIATRQRSSGLTPNKTPNNVDCPVKDE